MRDPRRHVSSGVTGSHLKLQARRAAGPLAVTIAGFALALAIFAYIAIETNVTAFSSTETLRFAVSSATGVIPGADDVRVSGLPAGRISAIGLRPGGQSVLTVTVRSSDGPFYNNALAELRPVTPLQDMYLDIVNRGTPSAGVLTAAHPLPAGQTSVPVNVDDVLDVFRPSVRANLAALLSDLGNGLQDRGEQLRQTFVVVAPLLQDAGLLTSALARREALVKQLVHNASDLTGDLGERAGQIRALIREANTTMGSLASVSRPLAQTLQLLPATMTNATDTLRNVSDVLPAADTAVQRLQPIAAHLPLYLTSVRKLAAGATPAFSALRAPVERLAPLASLLSPAASSLDTTVHALLPQVPTYNRASIDAARCKTGVEGFFLWDTSIGKYSDSRGPTLRGNLVAGLDASSVASSPFDFAPTACDGGTILRSGPATAQYEH
jgi:virulence factor Mce-like protein